MEINIIDSKPKHIKELVLNLRDDDLSEILRMGLEPSKAIFKAYRHAIYRKTALLDGKVLAMWGVFGTPLGTVGHPYLLTTNEINLVPKKTIVKTYLEEVDNLKRLFPLLQSYVDATYIGATRMLKLAGFDLIGPGFINGNLFFQALLKGDN